METYYDLYGNIKKLFQKCQLSVDLWPLNRKIIQKRRKNISIERCDMKVK